MARKRRKYTLEFKQEAVRLVEQEGMTYAGVEYEERRDFFRRAEHHIRSGPTVGGLLPPGKPFQHPRSGSIRVHVEIQRGINFGI